MELTERETLVKVQEQLRSSIGNQSQIVEDMREIFNRIDAESKTLAAVKGDLHTHLETSLVQRGNCVSRFDLLVKEIEKLSQKADDIAKRQEQGVVSLRDNIKNEEDKREALEKNCAVFQENVKASVRSFKIIVGVIVSLLGLLTPYITLILKDLLGK